MQYQILGQRGLLTLTTVGQHLPSCCLLHFSTKDKSAEVATDAKRLEEQLTSETVLSSSGPTVRCNTVGCAEGQTFIATSRRRKFVALVGCHANHVVRRQHHCQRCKRGQLLPRMLCGSTTAFRFGGLPCESRGSQVVPPDAVGPDEP